MKYKRKNKIEYWVIVVKDNTNECVRFFSKAKAEKYKAKHLNAYIQEVPMK